ncbi:hypothetical protein ANN_01377 [Periplaneta americana]|uniref:Uncharacterized protein n=1 Tax=Periplaneta americana TaxID=6978 RepID=A0ABQ8TXG5_PERAM|nr:hypothetical protein ANN_01377 [Periplaneta americana]
MKPFMLTYRRLLGYAWLIVLNLEGLALYWNPQSMFFSGRETTDMKDMFKKGICTKQEQPKDYKYMLGPINSSAQLRLNPKPEYDGSNYTIPKAQLSLNMEKLSIGISRFQYHDLIDLLESFERMSVGAPYRKYRPFVSSYRGHYKAWWHFAYTCILEETVRRRRRNWNWEHMAQFRRVCRSYAENYQIKLTTRKLPSDVQVTLDNCEKILDVMNIVLIRQKIEMDVNRSCLVPVAWQLWSEMEALIPSPAACEVRSVIKFFNAQSIAPIEIHRQLCQVYGPNIMSKQMVRRWCRQFSKGRQSVHDEERSGRPSLINDGRVELVRQCIMENRRFTITELSSHFPQISRSLLHEIVTKHLLFKKVCARWMPKNLTPEHKMERLGAALTFLQRYHDDGDELLDRIVMGDETWISHFTQETKQQSMHWQHSGSPVRTKFKQTLSVRKVMCTVFWDRKGILLIDFLPKGETVNADRYCETLRKLRRAIQNKRRGMLTAGVVFLHDNARPHTARRTAAVLTEFGWELFDQPPYSPDLAPSDFHVERMDRKEQELKKQKSSSGWFSGWFGGSTQTKEEEALTAAAIAKKFEDAMTPDEKAKLYRAIDYQENMKPTQYPKTFVEVRLSFMLNCLALEVRDDSLQIPQVISVELKSVSSCVEQRPSADALKLTVQIADLTVFGLKQDARLPKLVTSKEHDSKALLDVLFEKNPLDESCDQRIHVGSKSLEVVYDAETINKVVDVFKAPKPVNLSQLQAAAGSTLADFKEMSATGLQHAIQQQNIMDLKVDLEASYIVLPHGGIYLG